MWDDLCHLVPSLQWGTNVGNLKLLLRAFLPPVGMIIGAGVCSSFLGSSTLSTFLWGFVGAIGGFMCSYAVIRKLFGTEIEDDDPE